MFICSCVPTRCINEVHVINLLFIFNFIRPMLILTARETPTYSHLETLIGLISQKS